MEKLRIFSQIGEVLVKIARGILGAWIEADEWWSKKKNLEKANLRKNFFIVVLISMVFYQYFSNEIKFEVLKNDHTNTLNNKDIEINQLKKEETNRMKFQILKYEKQDLEKRLLQRKNDSLEIIINVKK